MKQQEVEGHAANVHNVDRLQKLTKHPANFLMLFCSQNGGSMQQTFSPSFATRRSTHRNFSSFCSKSQFRRDPLGVLEALLWKTGKQLAISEHGARSCVYAEGEAVIHKHKAGPEEVKRQLDFYRAGKFCVTGLST